MSAQGGPGCRAAWPAPPPTCLAPPGKSCQQADPCASNPCANGGQCLPFESSYICGCPPGFHGPTCRQDVNECSQSPGLCRHGGTCHNEVGSYRCVCRATHTGPHCELPYVPCSPSPCQNGGTCRPTGDTTYECACLPGRSSGLAGPLPGSHLCYCCWAQGAGMEGVWREPGLLGEPRKDVQRRPAAGSWMGRAGRLPGLRAEQRAMVYGGSPDGLFGGNLRGAGGQI